MATDNGGRPNRLAGQASPYLRAHAHDPVDWRPWSADAFDDARAAGKPVFLSSGYQSCHWCHVMQRESFRDHETAGVLNDATVPVKVDREIRPDVDALYLSYLAASTGSGGWPMSVFLTPDGAPLFGGTYFPPRSTDPRLPSFRDVIETVRRSWVLSREHTLEIGADALEFLDSQQRSACGPIDRGLLDDVVPALLGAVDRENGGFGTAPKFPQAPLIGFLLAYHRLTGDAAGFEAARDAVLGMVRGGTFDQVGGGLFRYSTDAVWLVPHFEKMLYDNALLLSSLADLHQIEPAGEYVHLARQTASLIGHGLARPAGGYFSSLDAETAGVEGGTYVWSPAQLNQALTPQEIALAEEYLGADAGSIQEDGTLVVTRRHGRGVDAVLDRRIDAILEKLLAVRGERDQPAVVENVLTSWNALAARGLIEAGAKMGEAGLLEQGLASVEWLLDEVVWRTDVLHAVGDPSVAKVRFLEDYTDVVAALLSAIEYGGREGLLKTATRLQAAAIKRFADDRGFHISAGDPALPLIPLRTDDSPTPGGAATLAENALRLASLTGDNAHSEIANRALQQYGRTARAVPHMAGHALKVATMREAAHVR
jgi:hypothetical protein